MAATGSWIEHGPTTTSSRWSRPLRIALTASRARLTVSEPLSPSGSSSTRMAGGSNGRKLSMRRSPVRCDIDPSGGPLLEVGALHGDPPVAEGEDVAAVDFQLHALARPREAPLRQPAIARDEVPCVAEVGIGEHREHPPERL